MTTYGCQCNAFCWRIKWSGQPLKVVMSDATIQYQLLICHVMILTATSKTPYKHLKLWHILTNCVLKKAFWRIRGNWEKRIANAVAVTLYSHCHCICLCHYLVVGYVMSPHHSDHMSIGHKSLESPFGGVLLMSLSLSLNIHSRGKQVGRIIC